MTTYSYVRYTASGAGPYSVPFNYRTRSDVTATVNGVAATFTWTTSSTITFDAIPTAGAEIEIRRSTSEATRLTQWSSINQIDANNLDTDSLQAFYLAQEAIDEARDTVKTANIADAAVTTAKIADGAVTSAKIAAGAIGTASLADDSVTAAKIAAGAVGTPEVADNAVTLAKMADVATSTVFYRKTSGTGDPEVQTLATLKTDLDLTGTNSGDQTITLTGDVGGTGTGSFAATIANDVVTNAKLANMATGTIKGRVTGSTGDPEDLTAAQATSILNTFTGSLKGLAPSSGGGTNNYLRADGTWAVPPGSGLTDGDKGDIVLSSNGAVWTIDNSAVTTAKINDDAVTAAKLADTAVTPGTYGSATQVGTYTVDAQGRLTAASNATIAIPHTAVSGLGTIATQSSSSVAITGGSVSGITDLAVSDGGTGASDAATARTNLGLAIGTNVQAYDAGLNSIAGLTTDADKMIYTTALDTYAVTNLTAAGRALIDDADATAQRTTLGLGTIATQAANNVAITGGNATGMTTVRSEGVAIGNTHQHTLYSLDANNIGIRVGTAGPFYALGNNEGAANVLRLNSVSNGDIVLTTGTGPEVERARIDVSESNLAVTTKFSLIRNAAAAEGVYSASGEYIQVTNSLDDKPYYAIRRAYNEHDGNISTGANTISDGLIAKWKSLTNGNAWNRWDVSITPLNPTSGLSGAPASAQQYSVINREVNPTNRHADTDGWFPEQRVNGKPWIIGEQMVPETQDFTALLGNTRVGYNVFGGYSVSRSPWTANFNKRRVTFSSSSGLLGTYTGDIPNLTPVRFEAVSAGVLPTGLSANTTYWTIRVSATTSRFATSLANAQSNTAISHTNSGTAPVDLIWHEWEHAKNHVGFQVNPNGLARGGYAFGAGGYKAYVVSVAVSNGGTGYTAGDLLTFNTGLSNVENEDAVVKVLTVNVSGVIQTAELFVAGAYLSAPTSPKGVTGGTGSGAQFSFTMATEDNVRPRGALQINGRFDYGIDFMPQNLSSGTTFPSTFVNHAIRLPNGTTAGIAARNVAGSADIPLIALNSSNIIQLGNSTSVFVDPTNNRLGIGAAPSNALDIVASAAVTARVRTTSGIPTLQVQSSQAGTSSPPLFVLNRVGASNAATPDGASIGEIRFDGLSTTPSYAEFASIECVTGTNTASGGPGELRFKVSAGGGTSTNRLTILGSGYIQPQSAQFLQYQPAPTTKAAAATLTAGEVYSGILEYTGAAATVTFPTGTALQNDVFFWTTTNIAFDFSVINTGTGTCTMAANGNTTVGSLTIAAGSSGKFRLRRTGAAAFTIYRIA
jgi:hypothetical protein